MLPDIYQIKCFQAVARRLSYSRAAEELFISRQALSKTIRRMEESLGPLFLLRGKTLELTPLGQVLLLNSVPLLDAWNVFEENMNDFLNQKRPPLQIAVSHGVRTMMGDQVFIGFRNEYPDILLSCEEMYPDAVTELVQKGEAEIGILGSVPSFLGDFDRHLLLATGMWLLFSASHPLAAKKELTPRDLRGLPIVGTGQHNHQHRYFLRECRKAGVEPFILMNMTYPNLPGQAPPEKDALYFAFPEYITPVPKGMVIRQLRIPEDQLFGTYAITRKGAHLSLQARLFFDFLEKADIWKVCGREKS